MHITVTFDWKSSYILTQAHFATRKIYFSSYFYNYNYYGELLNLFSQVKI